MPEPYYADDGVTLHLGDCLDVLTTLPDASVDAVVCDPPYGLGFMGKEWDTPGSFVERKAAKTNTFDHVGGNHNPINSADAARTYRVEGIRFGNWCEQWASECLRILKPGGYLAAFGGTRTYHRLACAIENAGFEVRDSLHWIYGSGFPKSKQHLKPSHEPIVLARTPLVGSVASNIRQHGTGGINIDGCRTMAGQDYRDKCASVVGLDSNRNGDAYGEWTGVREDSAHTAGRWPTNVALSHAPLLDDQGESVGDACADGCVPGCSVAEIDAQSGVTRSRIGKPRGAAAGNGWGMTKTGTEYDDAGGASRFFPVFRYEAKAPASERPRLPDGTAHPTVKPLGLMQWLVRLVTPPGGTVLDPFAGSGATLEACIGEGFTAIGVEKHQPYAELCKLRLSKPIKTTLFGDFNPAA
ncbi:DNA-methyltransferase [Streptomyces sp. NEAU-174]|uniref:DNA-methyltransferase n=1 Tax=Streptomyces sp. NEAU-174 TaxID=3458254 RepID=UPI004043D0FF